MGYVDKYFDAYKKAMLKDETYYSGCIHLIDKHGVEKWIPVKEGRPQYWPSESILGFTDLKEIWLKPGLGYLRDRILDHEKQHIIDPDADERTIRKRSNTSYL